MRTYQIIVNDQEYTVEIDNPNASPATVLVNGKPFTVTLNEQTVAGRPASGASTDIEADAAYMPMVTATFVETALPVDDEPTKTTAPAAAVEGVQQVVAPMPGKIMDITAQVGAQIKQGDVLCNLEAMKMKSPIRSTTDGVITQVFISEGQNVNYGDVLFALS